MVERSGSYSLARPALRQRVPIDKTARESLRSAVSAYVLGQALVPPLTLDELRGHAQALVNGLGCDTTYLDFLTVLVGNETWKATLATIPFDRRVLLLPQCLRVRRECPAPMDEIGLLCQECGRCAIGKYQSLA